MKKRLEAVQTILTSLPQARLTRRGFVLTALTTGFALAVRPVSAETVTTDTKSLTAGEVKIPTRDGAIPGYRAMPSQVGPLRSCW